MRFCDMSTRNNKIWITWERHRRTTELARFLEDVRLFEIESSAPRLIRYLYLLIRTIFILIKERPKLVIIQSPSNVLALFMVTIGRFFTKKIVVDAHNGGVRPFHGKFRFFKPFFSFIHRRSDLVIVTNKVLADVVITNGGTPFILEDKLPIFHCNTTRKLNGESNIVSICTFEEDEPFQEIINSASYIDKEISIYITGDYAKAESSSIIENASPNIIFTGYLPDEEYVELLYSCDAVIDLTMEPDCLVCGAYEAVSLEKPMILSDAPALRNYFNKGVVFTDNTSRQIAESISKVISCKTKMEEQICQLKSEIMTKWQRRIVEFENLLEEILAL
jgi:glycosyltransferase involved in cell wall biosynthesis